MKNFMKIFLFFSGMALSIAGACALFYKFFKKHCIIHIEFNPAEENSCNCNEEDCELCSAEAEAEEAGEEIEIEFAETAEEK